MAKEKINENFNLSFSSRDSNTSDTIMDCNISFENPRDDHAIVSKIATWLVAIGRTNIAVRLVNPK